MGQGAQVRAYVHEAFAVDWSAIQLRVAAVLVAAVAVCLGVGVWLGAPAAGMAAATGATTAGFGAFQRFSRVRSAPMSLAILGMSLCAGLGVALSVSTPLAVLGGGLVALACGMATQFGQAPWWFTLQWAVAYFIATATPGGAHEAVLRSLLVLAGGLLQLGVILLAWRWLPFGAGSGGHPSAPATGRWLRRLLDRLSAGRQGLRYALLAGAMGAVAVLVERALHFPNGYWVPMTALIILKPRRRDTVTRTMQRVAGTLLGGAVATLAAALARPDGAALAGTAILLGWTVFAFQRVNYAVFTCGITAQVVFLMAMNGLPELQAAWHRIAATLLGAALAILTGALIGQDPRAARA